MYNDKNNRIMSNIGILKYRTLIPLMLLNTICIIIILHSKSIIIVFTCRDLRIFFAGVISTHLAHSILKSKHPNSTIQSKFFKLYI